jgi:hypothetical protein
MEVEAPLRTTGRDGRNTSAYPPDERRQSVVGSTETRQRRPIKPNIVSALPNSFFSRRCYRRIGSDAAAIGTILGACLLLGRIAIGDWLTAVIGLVSLAVLFRWKVSNPLLIIATAVVGLIAFPWLQPTW